MYTVKNGRPCIMVQDSKKPTGYGYKWVYIPLRKWDRMTEEQRARYIID